MNKIQVHQLDHQKSMKESSVNLPLEVLGLFRIIFRTANKQFAEVEKSIGISGAQLWALAEIVNMPGITVTNLSLCMSLHQSTTSNLIEKLEEKGLIKRVRSVDDRRVVELKATQKGNTTLAKAPVPYRGLLPDALMRMDKKELTKLKNDLNNLVGLLEHYSSDDAKLPLNS
jgi:DNA-binding MarR family transcriptional regulator